MSVNYHDKERWEELVALHNENLVLPFEIVDGQGSVSIERPKDRPHWDLSINKDSIQTLELIGLK